MSDADGAAAAAESAECAAAEDFIHPEPSALTREYDDKVRPLIDSYNRIREHLRDEPEIHAAQIVVIGDQSAGKSSVLEALIRVSLPRGTGVVTKVPIVLESHRIAEGVDSYAIVRRGNESLHGKTQGWDAQEDAVQALTDDVWAALGSAPPPQKRRRVSPVKTQSSEKISMADIESRIREEQTAILRGRTFSDVPVYVDIYQSGVPDITLVDLPGINYETEGNKKRIRAIYQKYITPEESLILNIIPATSDIAANESCLFAKEADPKRTRTVTVLTKIDKADSDISDKLRGLGRFVVVRNRTQEELDSGITLDEVRRREEEVIRKQPALAALSLDCRGTESLARILVREDHMRMRSSIGRLLRKVPAKQMDIRRLLEQMPRPCFSDSDKRKLFDDWMQKVNGRIADLLRGKWSPDDDEDLHMNARLQDMFDNHERQMRAVTGKFFRADFRQATYKAVRESRGVTLANFIQDPVLKMLISREIQGVRHLADCLVDECCAYLVEKVGVVTMAVFDRFDQAGKEVVHLVSADLEKVAAEVKAMIQRLFEAELYGPYTVNHYYMDTLNKIRDQIRDHDHKEAAPAAAAAPAVSNPWSGAAAPAPTWGGPPQTTSSHGISDALADANVSVSELKSMVGISNDDQATFDMQCALFSYWKVVQKRLTDYSHMLIRSVLCRSAAATGLETWTEHAAMLSPLLNDPPDLAAERHELEYRLQQLIRVEQELKQIRE
eukprot:TRINITY_DN6124_c0_g2_i1.p1 TRINITY_DN6124_c0_g2~~TRINITY_DN6124_c0_g2_i1.p1  ORF type:complete len:763 (+),score=145.59 TRINITY_DN6124_c0_g2_i1:109-2289(+)